MGAGASAGSPAINLPGREKVVLLLAVGAVVALAWVYLVLHASHMSMDSAGHAMMGMTMVPWSATHFLLTFSMWVVMMVAMMLPSATPMILTYAAVVHRMHQDGRTPGQTVVFAAGYVGVWAGFSLLATALQWTLEQLALLSPTLVASSHLFGGGLLITAGIYQLLPFKEFCLRHCQGPLTFLTSHWRSGRGGALIMGLRHGAYCVGCCWASMLLLFVGGVMNLLWVALIAAFVFLEKLLPSYTRWGRWISGGGLGLVGVAMLSAG